MHFVNQIDFQILKPFFLKEVTEQAWEGAESRTVCHPSDGSGVVLTRTQADPVHTSASLWETPPQCCCPESPPKLPFSSLGHWIRPAGFRPLRMLSEYQSCNRSCMLLTCARPTVSGAVKMVLAHGPL